MSLELVQLRLENGYYRHREAVENDIVEAFASVCFLMLGRAAGRKKAPISIKRVARRATAAKLKGEPADAGIEKEEDTWVARVTQARDLYTTAIICVSNTKIFRKVVWVCIYGRHSESWHLSTK